MSILGLTQAEATSRRLKYGPNAFAHGRVSPWAVLLRQFKNSIIYLLLVAAAIAFALRDMNDGIAISVILAINAILGFSQEYRSERTAEKLSKLVARHVLVFRDGVEQVLEERFLVPGDVIVVKEGDIVPADCRILQANDFAANESQLTGESEALYKKEGDTIFCGSVAAKGEVQAEVVSIGNQTRLGSIARLSQETVRVTRYEKSLQEFGSFLIKLTLGCLAAIFVTKLFVGGVHGNLTTYFIFIIALAVAVVPEAMPVITTVTLASGAMMLARKHVVVKSVSAIEDLGNVSILCTDKTGTLTENKLSITGMVSSHPDQLQRFAYASRELLDAKQKRLASSFDEALTGFIHGDLRDSGMTIVREVPFDPEARRRRVILHDHQTDKHYLVAIGSAETIVALSHAARHEHVLEQLRQDGLLGLRHLGYAWKEVAFTDNFDILTHEHGLAYLGYFTLDDPLKETATHTIELARKLGVAVKIITGDSAEVGRYVGEKVGLLGPNDAVYTGEEIEHMSMQRLRKIAQTCSVFVRMTPEQKYGLIKILKETDTVAYQGDGINDAPALKLADVGIAVHTATDVAKESADILLLKEDLGVIINGIRYGRMTFVNINKYIKHTMVGNFAVFFALGACFLFFSAPPLLGIQLLLATIITDVPLVAIASDTVDEEELVQPSKYNIHVLMLTSLVLALATAVFQLIFLDVMRGQESGRMLETTLYLFIVFLQLTTIFSVRNRMHFWQGKHPSWQLGISVFLVYLIALSVPFIPVIGPFFSFVHISLVTIGILLLSQVLYIFCIDVIKRWYYQITPVAGTAA